MLYTRKHTRARARARTHTRTHEHTRILAQTHTHTRARARTHTHTRRRQVLYDIPYAVNFVVSTFYIVEMSDDGNGPYTPL